MDFILYSSDLVLASDFWPIGHLTKSITVLLRGVSAVHSQLSSWSPGQASVQSQSHSFIYSLNKKRSDRQPVTVRPLVRRRTNQPADWNRVDTYTDIWVPVGLSQAHSPPGAAGCQLTSWCFYPILALCHHWFPAPSLSLYLDYKKGRERLCWAV